MSARTDATAQPKALNRRAKAVGVVLAAALGLALAGRLHSDPSATAGTGQTAVRVAFTDGMDSLDPLMYIDDHVLLLTIFDPLTRTNAQGGLDPDLALSWSANEDATVWRFKLRDGARWTDGAPVTADDVLFTFQTIAATPTSPNRPYLSALERIEKVSEHEIQFTLRRPFASWPRQVTLIPIAPRKLYQRQGAAFADHPVGSGPYRVTGWERGERLELTANKDYWGGAPPVDKVTYVHVTDAVARFNALQSGDLDIIALTPQQVGLAKRLPGVTVAATPSNRVVYLSFNVNAPMLGDAKLRHGIDDAIDREAIAKYLLRGLATPIGELVSKVTFGYAPGIPATPYDPAEARMLIQASGYAGAPISFEYPTDGVIPLVSEVAEAVEGYLAQVGVVLRMRGMDQQSLIADWHARKMGGMYLFSYNPSTMDAGLVTSSLLGPSGMRYFSDPQMDGLEARQQAQADESQRAATFAEMWRLNKEQAYYLPLFNDSYAYAVVDSRVRFTPRADGYILAQDLRAPGE